MLSSTPTPPDPDSLVDRRRLKRQVTGWRFAAVVAAVAAIAAAVGRFELLGGEDHVALVQVSGIIVDDQDRTRTIKRIGDEAGVKALIVRIDSPGGTVVGGESLFRHLRTVAEKKPVVAVLGEVAASGGYMVALAADHIVAREGTLTGSIGVIMQSTDITGLLAKLGIEAEAIKSGPLKAVPSPLERLSDEGRAATRRLVDDMHQMFTAMVAERRGLPLPRATELADGRVFTGRQARAAGLVDTIGGEEEARQWLTERGISRRLPSRKIQIERDDDFWPSLVRSAIQGVTGKTYLSERLTLDGLVALWHPDLWVR
ncbi:MAG: signal peptide peptidase SppA [Alphaproteobacteria bacterium]|nr:signal peptide peptidase SppA [Alphaproteobacteria bacterium]